MIQEPTVQRDLQELHSWAEEAGVIRHNLNLLETSQECWGVTVSSATKAGTVVLQVPSSIILSSTRIRQELEAEPGIQPAIDYLANSQFRSQIPQFFLFLKVLLEHGKGPDSRWFLWLQSLPRQFDTSVTMDEVELACLPPFAWALANVERLHLHKFRKALLLLPESFLAPVSAMDEELTEWAFNVVFTRSWRYPEDDITGSDERCDIVPLGDMFNHGDMNINLEYDTADNVVVSLLDDAKAGQPLRLSYGKPSNPYRFLVMFGFVDETQPEIMCQVKVTHPSQRHKDMGYDFDKMVFRTQDGAIATPVWDVVLFSILAQVPDIQEAFYQAHMDGDENTKASIHERFLLETCVTLRKHVDRTLKEMKELHDEIVSHDETKHARLSMIRKNNEFVQQTFEKVKRRIDGMIQSEMARRRENENWPSDEQTS